MALACGGTANDTLGSSDGGLVGDVSNETGQDSGPSAHEAGTDSGPPIVKIGGRNFVARKLYLGDTDRSGVSGVTAWKAYGANVDGKVTTAASSDVCTLQPGAAKSAQADGNDGSDNSFGENILPTILNVFGAKFSTQLNAGIEGGGSTFMLDLTGLTDDTAQTLSPVSAQLFSGASIGTPTWNATSGEWGAYKSSLVGGSLSSGAITKFPTASISAGTWTTGTSGDLPFNISLGTATLALVVHHAVISFAHSSANSATLGNVSGVLTTDEFITAFKKIAGNLSIELCSGSTFDSIVAQFREASDILADGTNTTGVTCDGISIGFGFDATETLPPDVALGDPSSPDLCE
ncbi:MAG: hypothetical protein ABI183_24570 [Polyangiaceae bacterium]